MRSDEFQNLLISEPAFTASELNTREFTFPNQLVYCLLAYHKPGGYVLGREQGLLTAVAGFLLVCTAGFHGNLLADLDGVSESGRIVTALTRPHEDQIGMGGPALGEFPSRASVAHLLSCGPGQVPFITCIGRRPRRYGNQDGEDPLHVSRSRVIRNPSNPVLHSHLNPVPGGIANR